MERAASLFTGRSRRERSFVPNLFQSGLRGTSGVSKAKKKKKKRIGTIKGMLLKLFGRICRINLISAVVAFV